MYINDSQQKADWTVWLKRLGWFGLLFFLAKGVMWLTLPVVLVSFGLGY